MLLTNHSVQIVRVLAEELHITESIAAASDEGWTFLGLDRADDPTYVDLTFRRATAPAAPIADQVATRT